MAGDPPRSKTARRAVAAYEAEVFVSAASAWYIAAEYRLGKLPAAHALAGDIRAFIARRDFQALPSSTPNEPEDLQVR